MQLERRRVGRPRTRTHEAPGDYVGLRAPRELKERLERAAEQSGRSLSTEAQFRLDQSFRADDYLSQAWELAYGQRASVLLAIIGRALSQIERQTGRSDWMDDPAEFNNAVGAVDEIMEAFRPPGDRPSGAGLIGIAIGRGLTNAVKKPEASPLRTWAQPLNAKLGEVVSLLNPAPMQGPVASENLTRSDRFTFKREQEPKR